jgi:hypothetical protein
MILKEVIFGDAFPEEAVNLVWSLLHPSGVQSPRLKDPIGNPTIHPIAPLSMMPCVPLRDGP